LAWVIAAIGLPAAAGAQAVSKPVSEQDLRNHLIWNSPWEGRASTPPGLYSYRTVFRERRNMLIAEVQSYSTNQKGDSVVNFSDGALTWQDSGGAEVNVLFGDSGELVGTARAKERSLPIVLKPRP
jgi:hypothetical protein